jgi:hypothetical protein
MWCEKSTPQDIQSTARTFSLVLTKDERTCVADECKLYQIEEAEGIFSPTNAIQYQSRPVDGYWAAVDKVTRVDVGSKYKHLMKVVKVALCLAHGNAELERGFSCNKKMLHD